jgi:hypothetical protein
MNWNRYCSARANKLYDPLRLRTIASYAGAKARVLRVPDGTTSQPSVPLRRLRVTSG